MKNTNGKNQRERFTVFTGILLAVLIVYAILLFAPLCWALITSFKSQSDFRINIVGLPKDWTWNYAFVLSNYTYPVDTSFGTAYVTMPMQFVYSLLYALGCAFFGTLIPCVTAYLCARFPYKFSKAIYMTVIVTMILPVIGNLPSEIAMSKALGLYNHIWGLWIMKANFLGMYFLVFFNFYKSMPMAYTEAAKIDGAGNMSVLLKIVMPLSKNTFFTVMLIGFIAFWNDYQIPLVYLPSYPTVALGLFHMATTRVNGLSSVPMRMTSAVLMLIPILALFMCFHKRLLGNLTMGGIKG